MSFTQIVSITIVTVKFKFLLYLLILICQIKRVDKNIKRLGKVFFF